MAFGVAPGRDIQFGRMGPSGRADYVAIDESTGAIRIWINGCNQVIGHRNGAGTGATPTSCGALVSAAPTNSAATTSRSLASTSQPAEPTVTADYTYLADFGACDTEQEKTITEDWKSMGRMADLVCGSDSCKDVTWAERATREFIGPYDTEPQYKGRLQRK